MCKIRGQSSIFKIVYNNREIRILDTQGLVWGKQLENSMQFSNDGGEIRIRLWEREGEQDQILIKGKKAFSAIFPCCSNSVNKCPTDALKNINTAERGGEGQVLRRPCTKVIVPFPHCDDEAWVHWQIWNYWWPQSWENCCEPHGQVKQVWHDQP